MKATQIEIFLIPFIALVLIAVFFYPALIGNARTIQWDAMDLHYPHLAFFSRSIQNSVVPLWEPHLYCGYPFAGYLQSGAFYPVNFAVALFRTISPRIIIFLTVACYFFALTGLWFLSRVLHLSRAASALAAVSWVFSGQLLGHATHLGVIQIYAFFPWILLVGYMGRRAHSLILPILSASFLGWTILAGHFQTALYCTVFWITWELVLQFNPTRFSPKSSHPIPWTNTTARTIVIIVTGLAVCAIAAGVQLFSTADLALQSPRSDLSMALAQSESLQIRSLQTIICPNILGGIEGPYLGPWERTNQQCYSGLFAPLLWIIAMCATLSLFRRPLGQKIKGNDQVKHPGNAIPILLWSWVVLGFVFSLGSLTPFHKWMVSVIPGWNLVRTPSAILPLVFLCLSLLSALGFDWFMRILPSAMRPLVRVMIPLITILHLVIVYRNSDLMFGKEAPYTHFQQTAHRLFLDQRYAENAKSFRIHEWDIRQILLTNEASWKGWYQTGGRISGLHLKNMGELLRLSTFKRDVLDVLRVRYILVSQKKSDAFVVSTAVIPDDATPWIPERELAFSAPGILENSAARSLVFPVTSFSVHENTSTIEAILRANLNDHVILNQAPEISIEDKPITWSFQSLVYDLHQIEFSYSMDHPAVLVIGDTWTPDWQAWIDGISTPLLRANHAIRAIAAPAGSHHVVMRYRPVGYLLGLFLTLISVSISGALLCVGWQNFRFKNRT